MKTRENIVKDIMEETANTVPQIKNYRSGGVFRTFIEVVASFIEKFYQELETLLPNRFIMTAKGKWLDLKAEELSLTRYPATKTRGYVIFSRGQSSQDSSRAITIAKDKIIGTKSGLRFKVVADVELKENESSRSVLVEAEEQGSSYNIIGGIITEMITPISGIDSVNNTNDWIINIGKDEESDESLRSRCLALWQGLSGANKGSYIAWAKSIEGIGDVRVLAEARGLGTVDVICVGVGNVQAGKELLDKVQALINDTKPIATNILIKAPSEVIININISLITLPNYEISQDKIRDTVRLYFSGLGIGSDFEPSALSSVMFEIEGVKSVIINSPEREDISELQIARVGEIVIELSSALEQ